MRKLFVALGLCSSFFLAGCVSQQQADQKMAKGCEAAIGAMIAPKQILEVKSTRFADEQTEGSIYRRIGLTAVEKDGWIEAEKEYSCLFAQQWGLFRLNHIALLEQMTYNDEIKGKKDGKIIGSMEDFLKLTKAADSAMGQ